MPIILSCINLKGGVGKTAIAVNFAAYCGSCGLKTLLIDLDPQTNASFSSIGVAEWEKHTDDRGSVADLLGARQHTSAEGSTRSPEDIIYPNAFENVDLIPSHIDLFAVDLDLVSATAREKKLSRSIQPIKDNYDIIICDCPPNLTLPTQNALAISTHFVIPVSLDFLSAVGVGLLIRRVNELSDDLEIKLENAGIIISRVGRPANHRVATEASLRSELGNLVFENKITERAVVSEAASKNKSVFEMSDTGAIQDFQNVFEELKNKIGL